MDLETIITTFIDKQTPAFAENAEALADSPVMITYSDGSTGYWDGKTDISITI